MGKGILSMKRQKSFARGYSLIVHSFLTYWVYGTLIGAGLSVIVGQYCGMTGLDSNLVTSVNTVGGFLSVAMTFVIGRLVMAKGPRLVTVFSCIGTAIGLCLLANGTTLGAYVIWSVISQGLYNGYSFTTSNALITNWFPRKKGWIMGITTAGMMTASFTSVLLITVLSPKISFPAVCYLFAAFLALFGAVSGVWIVDTPEQCGLLPDNMPITEAERVVLGGGEGRRDWTAGQLILSRDGLCFTVGFGLLFIATTGGVTAFVPYMVERGYTPPQAVGLLSAMSVCGAVGSFVLGWVDSKWGTRKASLLFALLYVVGFFGSYLLRGTSALFLLPLAVTQFGGGANANLMASTLVSQYGRPNYAHVWSILFTGCSLIRNLCYLLIGTVAAYSGTFARVYLFWGVVSIVGMVLVAAMSFQYREAPPTGK